MIMAGLLDMAIRHYSIAHGTSTLPAVRHDVRDWHLLFYGLSFGMRALQL